MPGVSHLHPDDLVPVVHHGDNRAIPVGQLLDELSHLHDGLPPNMLDKVLKALENSKSAMLMANKAYDLGDDLKLKIHDTDKHVLELEDSLCKIRINLEQLQSEIDQAKSQLAVTVEMDNHTAFQTVYNIKQGNVTVGEIVVPQAKAKLHLQEGKFVKSEYDPTKEDVIVNIPTSTEHLTVRMQDVPTEDLHIESGKFGIRKQDIDTDYVDSGFYDGKKKVDLVIPAKSEDLTDGDTLVKKADIHSLTIQKGNTNTIYNTTEDKSVAIPEQVKDLTDGKNTLDRIDVLENPKPLTINVEGMALKYDGKEETEISGRGISFVHKSEGRTDYYEPILRGQRDLSLEVEIPTTLSDLEDGQQLIDKVNQLDTNKSENEALNINTDSGVINYTGKESASIYGTSINFTKGEDTNVYHSLTQSGSPKPLDINIPDKISDLSDGQEVLDKVDSIPENFVKEISTKLGFASQPIDGNLNIDRILVSNVSQLDNDNNYINQVDDAASAYGILKLSLWKDSYYWQYQQYKEYIVKSGYIASNEKFNEDSLYIRNAGSELHPVLTDEIKIDGYYIYNCKYDTTKSISNHEDYYSVWIPDTDYWVDKIYQVITIPSVSNKADKTDLEEIKKLIPTAEELNDENTFVVECTPLVFDDSTRGGTFNTSVSASDVYSEYAKNKRIVYKVYTSDSDYEYLYPVRISQDAVIFNLYIETDPKFTGSGIHQAKVLIIDGRQIITGITVNNGEEQFPDTTGTVDITMPTNVVTGSTQSYQIANVTALPDNPDANTIYLITD